MSYFNKLFFIYLFLKSNIANAIQYYPSEETGIGALANNLLEPVGMFSSLIYNGCLLLGSSFLFACIIKYFEHKRSPLMVPFSTVIFLFVSGTLLLLLPFSRYITDSAVHYAFVH